MQTGKRYMTALVITMGLLLGSFTVESCTSQSIARKFGGSSTVNLAANERVVTVIWDHSDDLWILTRDQKPSGEPPTTYTLNEHSGWGLVQGSVVIHEK